MSIEDAAAAQSISDFILWAGEAWGSSPSKAWMCFKFEVLLSLNMAPDKEFSSRATLDTERSRIKWVNSERTPRGLVWTGASEC